MNAFNVGMYTYVCRCVGVYSIMCPEHPLFTFNGLLAMVWKTKIPRLFQG